VTRNPDATWVLPSEDEWYKAAYYRGGGTNAGYWDYPTQSDTAPTAEGPTGTDLVNGSANYGNVVGHLCDVGAYTAMPSHSAYDTFDQGGNVWEWNETAMYEIYRGLRGGSFDYGYGTLHASNRLDYDFSNQPSLRESNVGFRVAYVPEPGTFCFLVLGGLAVRRRR